MGKSKSLLLLGEILILRFYGRIILLQRGILFAYVKVPCLLSSKHLKKISCRIFTMLKMTISSYFLVHRSSLFSFCLYLYFSRDWAVNLYKIFLFNFLIFSFLVYVWCMIFTAEDGIFFSKWSQLEKDLLIYRKAEECWDAEYVFFEDIGCTCRE